MNKLFSLLLILAFVFVITGCQSTLLNDEGFGQVIVTGAQQADSTPVSGAVVKVAGYEGNVGEVITVPAGSYDIDVLATINGLTYGNTVSGILVEAGETTTIPTVQIDVLSNAYRFTFDPADYNVSVNNEVHVVGEMNGWDGTNLQYRLIEQPDGTWEGIFDVSDGQEFKFMYDCTDWSNNIGVGGQGGANFVVGSNPEVVEPVLAWKFILDPDDYNIIVSNEVHVVGEMNDWDGTNLQYRLIEQPDGTWEGIFDVSAGQEFKFMYDCTDWSNNIGVGGQGGANFVVGSNPDVVTQNF